MERNLLFAHAARLKVKKRGRRPIDDEKLKAFDGTIAVNFARALGLIRWIFPVGVQNPTAYSDSPTDQYSSILHGVANAYAYGRHLKNLALDSRKLRIWRSPSSPSTNFLTRLSRTIANLRNMENNGCA